ncbi:elongation factor Ts [Patescibacteria group bacterium]|nr:elongation factor Ts [Patescibacteria group bacterium]
MSSLKQVKELRAQTGCGVVDCKEALEEAGDNIDTAVTILRKRGIIKATKKAERTTKEGVVAHYIHSNGKIGVLVTLQCETDFVARNEKFQALGRDIAMHIAAMDPAVVAPDDVSNQDLAAEQELIDEQLTKEKKPEEIMKKIREGKLKSFREDQALLTQPFVKDPKKKVGDLINQAVQELGENISVGEFTRLTI